MTKIRTLIAELERFAPAALQESYDNSQLIAGDPTWDCTGVLVTLDCTPEVVLEAIQKGFNLIVAHHPIVFSGLKSLTGKNYIERTMISALKNDIAIYACHTNLDHVKHGVNKKMADLLGLTNQRILVPKSNTLFKLETYVPNTELEQVLAALTAAGAGSMGNYTACSFSSQGNGRFTPNEASNPFIGSHGKPEIVPETKVEVLMTLANQNQVISSLLEAHPYQTPAYYVHALQNKQPDVGSGMIGELDSALPVEVVFDRIKQVFGAAVIKHTPLITQQIKTIAVCGGSGSFLLNHAKASKADLFITSDFKYHEFFDADQQIIIADIGHYETEHKTKELFFEILTEKFPNIAVDLAITNTNPVKYY